jgi:hypothetical protein
MAAKSYYLDNSVLAAVLTNTTYTSPTTVYAALLTTVPTNPAPTGLVEVSGGSYARQAVTFGVPSLGVTQNTAIVSFPTCTSPAWGTINGVALYDAATGGNLLYYGTVGTPKIVGVGDTIRFAMGSLSVTEA